MLAGFHIFNLVLVSLLFSSASYVAAIVKQEVPADAKEDCTNKASDEQKGLCHNLIQGFKGVGQKKVSGIICFYQTVISIVYIFL